MTTLGKKEQWEIYCTQQLAVVTPLLINEGFVLESEQPHLQGERYVLSGPKLVLYGARRSDGMRVVIKITDNSKIAKDLEHERTVQEVLRTIDFAYHTFHTPHEILFGHHEAHMFYITEYISQEKTFLEHTLEEQFFLALKALEAQEGSHATTHKHLQTIQKTFEVYDTTRYIQTLTQYRDEVFKLLPHHTKSHEALTKALHTLEENSNLLNTYSHFLTHWDFVPHNIRIHDRDIYLLDHSAIRFGNKYEGWARFMNFMTLYHPELEHALDTYVRENRSEHEYTTLTLMRLYRLSELVWFYASKRAQTEGDLRTLTDARINLWCKAIEAQLNGTKLSTRLINTYKKTRNDLRDEGEKKRQQMLH
ncbi:MAG: hypothetical protein UV60_C0045G0004 [Parcubacteria group bacterium GW2011_GWA2_43_11]|nr:MAG: hypothetical protein UV60_C0045G0004 [Parcubacteria group bacterium GW2011_GWA2_43_11]